MSPRFPLLYVRRLAGLLLLLTVMFHAAAPVGAPLDRQRGSAFSSATADVTLKARAKAVTAEATVALEPPAPPLRFARQAAVVLADGPRGQFAARAPPAAATTFAPLAPRAPPAA